MKIYVIMLDNELYDLIFYPNKPRYIYYSELECKKVIEDLIRPVARKSYMNSTQVESWYQIGERNKKEWLDKARNRFEVREFIERRD